jgi:putative copper export protein
MAPPLALTLLRWLHDAAMLSLFGALVFAPAVLPREVHPVMRGLLTRIAWWSGVSALLAGVAWLLAETASVAQVHALAAIIGAVPAFVSYLRFGQLLLGQLACIAGTLALCRWPGAALGLAGCALALQPWLGHPGEAGVGIAVSELLHLLAAATWLGGLLPLLACLAALPPAQAARAFRRFTWIGLAAVLTLWGSGLAQGLVLAGGAHGLIATIYGHVALLKAGLFVFALVFAAINAFILTARLARDASAMRAMHWTVSAEALIGCAILLAAAWLAGLPPGT